MSPALPDQPLKHVLKCHTPRCLLNTFRKCDSTTFPRQTVQCLTTSSEFFPLIHPLVQLEAVSTYPVTYCLGEEFIPTLLQIDFRWCRE